LSPYPNEQVPVGQVPVGHEDAPRLPLDPALNADNSFLGFIAPHLGHFLAGSDKLRARCSKAFPHLSHLYSYIGIISLSCFSGY